MLVPIENQSCEVEDFNNSLICQSLEIFRISISVVLSQKMVIINHSQVQSKGGKLIIARYF
jgi:hypothetical protein